MRTTARKNQNYSDESNMNRRKSKTVTAAKPASEEKLDTAKYIQFANDIDSSSGLLLPSRLASPNKQMGYHGTNDKIKKTSFRGSDLIMKLSCCNEAKTKSSLLKSSDTIYSLLCATYLTYSTSKEKLVSASEILKEVTKGHNRLEQDIRDKRETLREFKNQQKRMKSEKVWFKARVTEYNQQSLALQERENKLQKKKDSLRGEYKSDKAKLDQLADELGTYLNFKAMQYTQQIPAVLELESQDDNDLKSILTDFTDSEPLSSGPPKELPEPLPIQDAELVKYLPPKTPKSKSMINVRHKGKLSKDRIGETAIQNLICEDLLTLHQCYSDEEPLFTPKSDHRRFDNKLPEATSSGVTIISTSESTVSWMPPKHCQYKNSGERSHYCKGKK